MKTKLLYILLFISSYTFAQIPNDEIIRYLFTGGSLINEVNSSNNILVQTGTNAVTTTARDTQANNAYQLNGDNFFGGNTNTSVTSHLYDYSISFWLKTTTNDSQKRILISDSDNYGYEVWLQNGLIYFGARVAYDNGGLQIFPLQVFNATTNVSDGNWHHVTFTIDAIFGTSKIFRYKLYVDAVEFVGPDSNPVANSVTFNQRILAQAGTPNRGIYIGKNPNGTDFNFEDEIDDIRVYERLLTPSEITSLSDEGMSPIVYVDANATGNNDGTSWQNAYVKLEDAFGKVNTVNEIWVAQGVYTPTGTGRDATYEIPKNAKIYGGFIGTENEKSQRDIKNNITVLSGDLNGDDNATVTHTEPLRQDNVYHVISLKGNVDDIIIDGFTISDGNANGTSTNDCANAPSINNSRTGGGAVYTQPYSSGTVKALITNCILENNSASGSAVYTTLYPCGQNNVIADVDFTSCIIRNNFSQSNSAFFYIGLNGNGQYSRGDIINSLFHNNTSVAGSACIHFRTYTNNSGNSLGIRVNVINSTFANNTGVNGNVIQMYRAGNSKIENSIFWDNGSTTPLYRSGSSASQFFNTISEGGQFSTTNSNPLFTDATNNDFTLTTGSPAVDTGDNTRVPSGITTDLLFNQRIHNTTVDMGCYEFGAASTLSTEDFTSLNNELVVYPNPVENKLYINSQQEFKKLEVYSILGKKVKTTTHTEIDVTDLSQGMYILKVYGSNGSCVTKKFVKQ